MVKNILKIKKDFATLNLTPGKRVYGEKIIRSKNKKEYRVIDPKRSKFGAALRKGMPLEKLKLNEDSLVLYLGVASGTTASHISDIVANGIIYGVDIAPRVLRDLILLSEIRKNIAPILGDASVPKTYMHIVPKVDFLYQDVAQPNQADILIRNAEIFLPKGKQAFVAIKARSIDVTKPPKQVFKEFKAKIQKYFNIIDERRLDPFEKDHLALLLEKK